METESESVWELANTTSCEYVPPNGTRNNLWLSPVPDWKTGAAQNCLGDAWPFHNYFFGSCFLVLGLVSVLQLVLFRRSPTASPVHKKRRLDGRSKSTSGLLPPPVFILMATLGILRAVSLFTDPYGSEDRLPKLFGRVIFGLGFTSLLAAYQLLFVALHAALRMEVGSFGWLRKRWLIFAIVAFFLTFNTLVDIILVQAVASKPLLVLCMFANVAWCALMIAEFSVIAYRLHNRLAFGRQQSRSKIQLDSNGSKKGFATSTSYAPSSNPRNIEVKNGDALGRAPQTHHPPMSERQPSFHQKVWMSMRRKRQSSQMSSMSVYSTGTLRRKARRQVRTQEGIERLALLTVVLATIHFSFQWYMIFGTLGAADFDELIRPRTWYAFVTVLRLVELALAASILATLIKAQFRMRKQWSTDIPDGPVVTSSGTVRYAASQVPGQEMENQIVTCNQTDNSNDVVFETVAIETTM